MVQQFAEDNNQDIAHFLEKLNEQNLTPADDLTADFSIGDSKAYDQSFEKLENKIEELEQRFESSAAQNRLILSELAHTRSELNRQKSRDAFLEHISRTIASLKNSVENLSRERQTFGFYEGAMPRTFDPVPPAYSASEEELHAERIKHQQELAEKERVFSSLRQKASQLKAVNSALDREIKKVQQEKMDALKKSAEQAKEILSLRDQLTAAEERFKSFNFEGRIISIKRQYEQKVSSLETQLKEISNTCMKQVEEIEALKSENLQLQNATKERDELKVRLQEAQAQVVQLKEQISALQQSSSKTSQANVTAFQARLREVEARRDGLSVQLEQATLSLEGVRQEKAVLENNFRQLLAKINGNDQIISELKQKIEVLAAQNETLAQANKELEDRNGALTTQTDELGQQNESLLEANRKLVDRNALLANQNKTLSSANADLSDKNKTLSSANENLANQNKTLSSANADLSNQNKTLSSANENLANQNKTLSSANADLSTKNQVLSSQNADLNARNANLTQKAGELSQETRRLDADKAKLTTYISKLNQEKHSLEKENQNLADTNRALRGQSAAMVAAHLEQQKKQAKEELNKLQQPTAEDSRKEAVVLPVKAPQKAEEPAKKQEEQTQNQKPLPEIKVSKSRSPMFNTEPEDFLEKTNTFIGRMRWSVFEKDK